MESARAIITRWRSPIDSVSERWPMRSPSPRRSSSGAISRRASRQRLVLSSFSVALSIALTPGSRSKLWRMNPSSASLKCEASRSDRAADVALADQDRAGGGCEQHRDHQQQRRLARPARPVQRDRFAGGDRQRDAVHRAHRLAADGRVVLDEVAQLQHRCLDSMPGCASAAIPARTCQSETLPLTCTVIASSVRFRDRAAEAQARPVDVGVAAASAVDRHRAREARPSCSRGDSSRCRCPRSRRRARRC